VRFDADRHGTLSLGLEGGHAKRRVVHAGGSATGRRVVRELSALVVAEPRITVLEAARAADLWCHEGRVAGVLVEERLAIRPARRSSRPAARRAVVAHDQPAGLDRRRDGPRAPRGARLADLEFLQFHPTAVVGVKGREGFLVTEAIRGEGATLHGPDGERFVEELAPRDEVALAIYLKLARPAPSTSASTCATSTRRSSPTSCRSCASRASIRRRSASRSRRRPTT
jgi:L-aspartate oxidase